MDIPLLPAEFLSRLQILFPEKNIQTQILEAFKQKNIFIRINTLKTNIDSICRSLESVNITYKKISWYKEALQLENITSKEITELPIYTEGKIYIQSLSSMIPALVLNPTHDDVVLDMAAAPGSKTSQIAMIMENKGSIIANDMSHERLYKLKANILHLGVTNTTVTNSAGQSIWQKYPEYFDKVLVDAPCSMEGRIQIDDPTSYEDWSTKKIKRLSKLQKWLLRSAVSATKVGGIIVYSTCTLAPEENEEVIDWIMEKENEKIQLEEIAIHDLDLMNGISEWKSQSFHTEILKTKRIVPSLQMEGFFIAKIKKIASNVR